MRLVALGLAAAAAFAVPGPANAAVTSCTPGAAGTAVCVEYECNNRPCTDRTYTAVYTTCQQPFAGLCRRVDLPPR